MTLSQLWGARRERCRTRVTPEGKRSPYTRHSFPATAGRPETALSSDLERTPLGARGQHRTGFYVATLYALERYYGLQAAAGLGVAQWRPAPRQRPDQFVAWTRDSLLTLGISTPSTLPLEPLAAQGLPHIARMVEHCTKRRLSVSERTLSAEIHPQVRKFARVLRNAFDPLWCRVLERLAATKSPSQPELLLGGLPLGFGTLEHLISSLGKLPATELTTLQFYGLATGKMPDSPVEWEPGLTTLRGLQPEDLACLSSLSHQQIDRLSQLDEDARFLVQLRCALSCTDRQWHAFSTTVSTLHPEEIESLAVQLDTKRRHFYLPGLRRTEAQGAALLLACWPLLGKDLLAFKRRLTPHSWQNADLDAELRQLLCAGILSANLLERLRQWTPELRKATPVLLKRHGLAVRAWLEDEASLASWISERSNAKLDLATIFPESTSWLERHWEQQGVRGAEALALSAVEDIRETAGTLTKRVDSLAMSLYVSTGTPPAASAKYTDPVPVGAKP